VANPGHLPVGSPALLATPGSREQHRPPSSVGSDWPNSSQAFKINRLGRCRWQVRDKLTNDRQRTMVVKIEVSPLGKAHEALRVMGQLVESPPVLYGNDLVEFAVQHEHRRRHLADPANRSGTDPSAVAELVQKDISRRLYPPLRYTETRG
jgi:hypothetical protein